MRLALATNAVSAFRNDERHGRYRLTEAIGTGATRAASNWSSVTCPSGRPEHPTLP
jgi:hypothetical protein